MLIYVEVSPFIVGISSWILEQINSYSVWMGVHSFSFIFLVFFNSYWKYLCPVWISWSVWVWHTVWVWYWVLEMWHGIKWSNLKFLFLGFILFYCFVCTCLSKLVLLDSEAELLSTYITISCIKFAYLSFTFVNYNLCCECQSV